jgi:hypothetical protein
MADKRALLTSLYDAMSRQDVDGVLALMHPEIDWPNTLGEGRVQGLDALRAYWRDQFALVRLSTAMLEYREQPDGSVITKVSVSRHTLAGALWDDQVAYNRFRFEDGLIVFGDWVSPADE